jgi:hypothetical protein
MRRRREQSRRRAVYYAHPICTYGRLVEHRELTIIRRRFGRSEIVNPADYRYDPEKLRDQIGFCLDLVARADLVVFSRLLGKVTAGVGKEVNHALKLGKRVYEIAAGRIVERHRRVTYITPRATRSLYRKWRRQQYPRGWGG